MLKKVSPGGASSSGDVPSDGDEQQDQHLTVDREKCVPVVKGLVVLLLSMDFTCNVDLFLVACKVGFDQLKLLLMSLRLYVS